MTADEEENETVALALQIPKCMHTRRRYSCHWHRSALLESHDRHSIHGLIIHVVVILFELGREAQQQHSVANADP